MSRAFFEKLLYRLSHAVRCASEELLWRGDVAHNNAVGGHFIEYFFKLHSVSEVISRRSERRE